MALPSISSSWPFFGSLTSSSLFSKGLLDSPIINSQTLGSISPPSVIQLVVNPPLPYQVVTLLQFFRFVSFMMLFPIFIIGIIDFAGYAVFRTLGYHRRRVRVKRQDSALKSARHQFNKDHNSEVYLASANSRSSREKPTPSIVKAPLLSPGTYDAEILLRHRARSLSGASAEAEEEWLKSGGYFARIGVKKTNSDAGDDGGAISPGSEADPDPFLTSLPDSSRSRFARAENVGVDGAMGLVDTDVEDSGTESGRNSPVQSFRKRKGLGGSFGFTPMSQPPPPTLDSPTVANPTSSESSSATSPISKRDSSGFANLNESVVSLGSATDSTASGAQKASSLTGSNGSGDEARSNLSSSWVGIDEGDRDEKSFQTIALTTAADLEPESNHSLYNHGVPSATSLTSRHDISV
ncbi:hypothetical protein IE53DRAFT_319704 [Violaceomyces palustris]|uniref:Uncharacterized protein n=1 Tax=Violaceomyces palustris TaxID=1673888 RepID=A0ACD0NR63_9BASI|nr:hypothetical protein IE53DRAFT_319704 [Violaceomyces palustris]